MGERVSGRETIVSPVTDVIGPTIQEVVYSIMKFTRYTYMLVFLMSKISFNRLNDSF